MKIIGISQDYSTNYSQKPNFKGDFAVYGEDLTELATRQLNKLISQNTETLITVENKQSMFNKIMNNIKKIQDVIINKYSPMAHFNSVYNKRLDGINIITNIQRMENTDRQKDFHFYYYQNGMTYIDLNDTQQIENQREKIELQLLEVKNQKLEYFRNIHRTDKPSELRYSSYMEKPEEYDPYKADIVKAEYKELLAARDFYNEHKDLETENIKEKLYNTIRDYEYELQRINEDEVVSKNIELAVDTSAINSLITGFSKAVCINAEDLITYATQLTNDEIKNIKTPVTAEEKQKVFNDVVRKMKESIYIIQNKYSPMAHVNSVCKSGSGILDIVTSTERKYLSNRHAKFYFYDDTKRSLDISNQQQIEENREGIELSLLELKNTMLRYYKDIHRTDKMEDFRYTSTYKKPRENDPYNKEKIKAEYQELIETRDFYNNHKNLLTDKINEMLDRTIQDYEREIQSINEDEILANNIALNIDTTVS